MSEIATRLWWIRHAPVDHGGRSMASKIFPATARKPQIFPGSPSNYRATRSGLQAICAAPTRRPGRLSEPAYQDPKASPDRRHS